MAEIFHFENRPDVILFAVGGPIWIKFRRLVRSDVDCGDTVEIGNGSRIPIWRMFGRIEWHVTPEPRVTLQGAATWRI